MRRITLWIVGTVCGLVLLFAYRTSTMGPAGAAGPGAVAPGDNPPGIVSGAGATAPAPSSSSAAATGRPPTTGTGSNVVVNGSVEQTRWGPVQVQVKISSGRIVDVVALRVPDGNGRDYEINSYAVPQLRQEVLDAQSANIDTVSGATVTSDGYIASLQAALDSAHFKG